MTNPTQPRSGQDSRERQSTHDSPAHPQRDKGKTREADSIIEKPNRSPASLIDEDKAEE